MTATGMTNSTSNDHVREIRGSKTDAYRYAYRAARDGQSKAATLGSFLDPQSEWLARNGWEDGMADAARCPDCGSGVACSC